MRARDVLEQQMDLVARLTPGSDLAHVVESFAALEFAEENQPEPVYTRISVHANHGTAYHVENDMTDLIMRRARSITELPVTEVIEPPDVCGFVVLDEPIRIREIRGRMTHIHVITWGPIQAEPFHEYGSMVVAWCDIIRGPDEVWLESEEIAKQLDTGNLTPVSVGFIPHGKGVGPPEFKGAENLSRIICAMWQLFGETIPTRRQGHPDRATGRRAMRAFNLKHVPLVEIVTLRRERSEVEHPGTGKPLEWRVPVKQHYRTYHTLEGTVRRKIAVHWRGPEGAPVRATNKVYNLER